MLLVLCACGDPDSEPSPVCGGEAPSCVDLVPVPPAPASGCCGDVHAEALCEDGAWRCPAGHVLESECRGAWTGDGCGGLRDGGASDAPLVDADVTERDAAPSADASVTCDPEAMLTPNADLTEAASEGGCPPGMVLVDTFCIDRHEASLAVVNDDGSLTSWSPFFNPEGRRVRALSLSGAVPQAYVSGVQAAAAGDGCLYATTAHPTTHWDYSTGFRCCADP